MRLNEIRLRFTATGELTLPGNHIVIFVGPNNSGKSLILNEMAEWISSASQPYDRKILQHIEPHWPDQAELLSELAKITVGQNPNRPKLSRIASFSGGGSTEGEVDSERLVSAARERSNLHFFFNSFIRFFSIVLDGRSRLNLISAREQGDLTGPPKNILALLLKDNELRAEVRSIIHRAFGFYLALDPTLGGQIRPRVSVSHPQDFERRLDDEAIAYHHANTFVTQTSDGTQAFIGLICALLCGKFFTYIVDEPEAFLHPPLARRLGLEMARLAHKRKAAVFASTHSSDFLSGCLAGAVPVSIVRLEFKNGSSSGRLVDPEKLKRLTTHPLMRSGNVLSGLFYDGVVVCESDADEVFYSEIYTRMAALDETMPSVLFVHAQNKQTLKEIVGALRECSVPTVAVADIDLLENGGTEWKTLLEAAQVPNQLISGFSDQRARIWKALTDDGNSAASRSKVLAKRDGISLLSEAEQDAAETLFESLAKYGIFVLPVGELESWLRALGVKSKKPVWLLDMLNRMGTDPNAAGYVTPASDDVWDFMRKILSWIGDPQRRGLS